MEYKDLTEKEKIPVIGLGTWKLFDADAIRYAIDKGITHIDTAEVYGSEPYIGKAIKNFDRKKLFITTKISPNHLFTSDQIIDSCRKSLENLETDYLDLYLIHWPNPLAPIKNVMNTFDKLVDEGLVRHIGVSNFSADLIKKSQQHTKNKIVADQVHYNLLYREAEKNLLPFCQEEKIVLTAYSPLAKGELTSERSKMLEEISKRYDKTPIQVALRWLIEKPQVIAIPKSANKEHIDEILGSLGWNLEKEDQELLDKNY